MQTMQLSSNYKKKSWQYMMESNILAGNASIKQQPKEVLLCTKGQYMKESNILAGNAAIKQL